MSDTSDIPELTPPPEIQDPTVPMYGYWSDVPEEWLRFHRHLKAGIHQANPEVVFIGDSITQGWAGEGKEEWERRFAPLGAFNIGIGGDRTQQLLWRIHDGVLDDLNPKLVVLKIGVNNLWVDVHHCGTDRVAEGIASVVRAIAEKCPNAKILVLGILPAGEKLDDPLRGLIHTINAETAKLDNGATVRFADIGKVFESHDGSLSPEIMPDYLHLSPEGYTVFADAIEPMIHKMLQ